MDNLNALYELCETLSRAVEEVNGKLGGKLSAADLEYVDKLTHSLKSVKAVISMEEEGQSYAYAPADIYADKSYRRYRGGSYRGNSMAGYSNRRNSMGRYSRDGFTEQLEQLMNEAPNEQVRNKLQTMLDQM